jgi:putative tryptophan/tyrosine transport system substrate-binding protein
MTMLVAQPGNTAIFRPADWIKDPRNLIRRIAIFRWRHRGPRAPVYILGSANFPWKDSKFESFPLQRRVRCEPISPAGEPSGKPHLAKARISAGFLAAELVRLAPEVIVAASPRVVAALKQLTSTIPIVMTSAGDPVGLGFVASLARPGGNITGLSTQSQDMAGKWVEMLTTAAPGAKRIAFLFNSGNPAHTVVLQGAREAAQSLRIELLPIDARTPDELDGAFAAMAREHVDALIGWGDPVLTSGRIRIVDFAATHKVPAIYQFYDYVAVGGLMSFGPDLNDLNWRAAAYVDKILKGAKPADLPVEQPTKFRLAVNLKAAQALGLTIPPLLLARADEVIE